eukprot:6177967-Pleurochrysis_carterae.AAC.1
MSTASGNPAHAPTPTCASTYTRPSAHTRAHAPRRPHARAHAPTRPRTRPSPHTRPRTRPRAHLIVEQKVGDDDRDADRHHHQDHVHEDCRKNRKPGTSDTGGAREGD